MPGEFHLHRHWWKLLSCFTDCQSEGRHGTGFCLPRIKQKFWTRGKSKQSTSDSCLSRSERTQNLNNFSQFTPMPLKAFLSIRSKIGRGIWSSSYHLPACFLWRELWWYWERSPSFTVPKNYMFHACLRCVMGVKHKTSASWTRILQR